MKENMVVANEFCECHHIEVSFIESLSDSGLIETTVVKEKVCFPEDELEKIERLVNLRYQLDINMEGIEAISHLLNRIESMQAEIRGLRNQLRRFE